MSDAAPGSLAMATYCGVEATVAELLADPSRARDLSQERAAVLLVQLAALQAALAAKFQAAPVAVARVAERPDRDSFLTVEEAAQVLRVPTSWLYRRSKELPFAKQFGGTLRFSERGLRAWAAKQEP